MAVGAQGYVKDDVHVLLVCREISYELLALRG